MKQSDTEMARQLAIVASELQKQRTGYSPRTVTVVLSEDTMVITLLEALTPAEIALSQTPQGASQVQDYHKQLFANSVEEMRREIKRITGREVREAASEVAPSTGTVVHAFTTGAMVQVFLLTPNVSGTTESKAELRFEQERADDDGLRSDPGTD